MAKTELIKSACGFCSAACGVQVTLEDGQVIKIEGDPESPPNRGALCIIGDAALEFLYHPDRLKYPLKRVGERGEGKWQQISWDDALTTTAETFNRIKRESGPEAVFMGHGSAKSFIDTHLVRFANAFRTPNVVTADHICHVPRMLAAEYTLGFFPGYFAGSEWGQPACIVSWGANKQNTRFYTHNNFVNAAKKGAKLIVIDSLRTELAKMADVWLQPRPGTDLALALGMINVIINEKLYDQEFVANWTVGFDRLKTQIQQYPPEKVAEITWIPADQIQKAARLYATTRPGHIEQGNAFDQTINSFQFGRAITMLQALTGNIGLGGGEKELPSSGLRYGDLEASGCGIMGRWSEEFELRNNLTRDQRQRRLGAEFIKIPDFRYALPQALPPAILEGKPYPVRAGFIQAVNPLVSWTGIKEVYQAFKKLDFLAVSDFFMSTTAQLADIVFPVATYLEFDGIQMSPNSPLSQAQRKVAQVGECRSDHEILMGLMQKMGLGKYTWNSLNEFWDFVVKPAGFTYKEFREKGRFPGTDKPAIKKYERSGFNTPSGKVELYSSQLEKWGVDPLPVYSEYPETPFGTPNLVQEYPLIFTYGKIAVYRHSTGRQIPSLRKAHPEPITLIHPETASKLGIKDGDLVYIESKHGKIKQKASISTDVDPRVVFVDPCWWFPENKQAELGNWTEANYNMLTSSLPPYNVEVGSLPMRGLACKVYKAS